MARVIWDNGALRELDQIIVYIEQYDPDAADRIASQLFDLGESLAEFPQRGRPGNDGDRGLVTVRPYVLRYRVVDDEVTILSIRHGARRPE